MLWQNMFTDTLTEVYLKRIKLHSCLWFVSKFWSQPKNWLLLMSACSWNQVQVKILKLQDQNLKETNSASLIKNHGWTLSLSLSTPSVNQQFLISRNSPIWSKRTNLVGFNISKRMTLKTIRFLIWQKEWVNKSKKWEHLWKCVW